MNGRLKAAASGTTREKLAMLVGVAKRLPTYTASTNSLSPRGEPAATSTLIELFDRRATSSLKISMALLVACEAGRLVSMFSMVSCASVGGAIARNAVASAAPARDRMSFMAGILPVGVIDLVGLIDAMN